jgi:hypothetical protein
VNKRSTAALIFIALAVLHTWPLASAPHRLSLNHNADAQLNAWIVSWVAHSVPTEPARFWHGNIFQPGERALTFSEPLIVPALAGAPVAWLGGSPVLLFNVLLIAGLAATGFAGWWAVTRWTGSFGAGVVAGALLAFNPHLLTRLPHLQAAHAWGLILACYFADRALRSRGPWWPLVIVWPLVAATSLHILLFAAGAVVLLAITTVAGATAPASTEVPASTGRGVIRLSAATAAGAILALPVLWPYLTSGVTRPLAQVADFSATPAGYLTSMSRMHQGWTAGFFTTDINVFFPGFVALGLAVLGAVASRAKARDLHSGLLPWLLVLAVLGILLSLGTATPLYGWLYDVLPPLQGIRAAARFGIWYLMAVAVLAGFGIARLERRMSARLVPWLVTACLAAVTAENIMAPVRTTPFGGVPAVYSLLAQAETPVLLAEFPFYPPDMVFENGEYVLNAAGHWRPVMNGYSGLTPLSYRERTKTLWFFPDQEAVDTLVRDGATHAMVHLERFGNDAEAVTRALDRQPALRLVAADRDGHRLYRVVAKPAVSGAEPLAGPAQK